MPHEIPAFLQEFINHRKQHSKKETPAEMKKVERGQTRPNKELETSVQYIIDKKPDDKAVKEYIQTRLEMLDKEKIKN